ncbi:APC family permease [Portibacter marinus]|uniref:APC family permease n=1 Tax=Portibacter marinus TaxID=2898660 RepID=UPI001F2A0DD8|nr:amino acid permease [Portibacter marinus]
MDKLQKKITLFGLTMIAVGSCIGAGIFVTPAVVAQAIPNQFWIIMVWVCGGVIAFTGALSLAELGSMFPKAGGVYVFLRETYGEIFGFLYGWIILLAVNTGALAALSMAFSDYLVFFFPLLEAYKLYISIILIALLSMVNCLGVNISQLFSNVFTVLKLSAMILIVLFSFSYLLGDQPSPEWQGALSFDGHLISAFFLALIGVLWSFGGWHHASYLASETVNPTINVPKAMILGALIVTIVYILINCAYMIFLPLEEMAASGRVAGDAVSQYMEMGGKLVSGIVLISIFGTISIYSMSAPRVYYAMAKDGVFLQSLSKVHARFNTPVNAIMLQGIWAIIIIIAGKTFKSIITYATFMDVAFMALAAVAVLVLRVRKPELERPFKVPLYPIIPLIFISITSVFILNTLIFQPFESFAGIGLTLLGIPIYLLFKKYKW